MTGRSGLILFVDDEYYVLETLKNIFRRAFPEYHVDFALDGEEALDLLSQYDSAELKKLVVVSDWMMPGMKGDELLLAIHEKYPQSVNFLLSGMINQEPKPDLFERAGIKQVLLKPWSNDRLIEIIKNSLE